MDDTQILEKICLGLGKLPVGKWSRLSSDQGFEAYFGGFHFELTVDEDTEGSAPEGVYEKTVVTSYQLDAIDANAGELHSFHEMYNGDELLDADYPDYTFLRDLYGELNLKLNAEDYSETFARLEEVDHDESRVRLESLFS